MLRKNSKRTSVAHTELPNFIMSASDVPRFVGGNPRGGSCYCGKEKVWKFFEGEYRQTLTALLEFYEEK